MSYEDESLPVTLCRDPGGRFDLCEADEVLRALAYRFVNHPKARIIFWSEYEVPQIKERREQRIAAEQNSNVKQDPED